MPWEGVDECACLEAVTECMRESKTWGCGSGQPSDRPSWPLTLDHDHVDVDGADGWLREALSFLQDSWDLTRRDSIVRLGSKGHQLPNSDSYEEKAVALWVNNNHGILSLVIIVDILFPMFKNSCFGGLGQFTRCWKPQFIVCLIEGLCDQTR